MIHHSSLWIWVLDLYKNKTKRKQNGVHSLIGIKKIRTQKNLYLTKTINKSLYWLFVDQQRQCIMEPERNATGSYINA